MPFSTRTSACTGLANLARREVQELTPNRHARGSYPLKKLSAAIVIQMVIGFALAGVLRAQSSAPLAPSASEINQKVTGALNSLYAHNPKARELGAKAEGILVFPDIKKGAFLIGAPFGFGALRKGGRTAGYYRTAAASYCFQAGPRSLATRSFSWPTRH